MYIRLPDGNFVESSYILGGFVTHDHPNQLDVTLALDDTFWHHLIYYPEKQAALKARDELYEQLVAIQNPKKAK